MDWFSAKSWCEAIGKKLANGALAAYHFDTHTYSIDYDELGAIGLDSHYWTSAPGNLPSCSVMTFSVEYKYVDGDSLRSCSYCGSALCE